MLYAPASWNGTAALCRSSLFSAAIRRERNHRLREEEQLRLEGVAEPEAGLDGFHGMRNIGEGWAGGGRGAGLVGLVDVAMVGALALV